jgi:hypothetical protein
MSPLMCEAMTGVPLTSASHMALQLPSIKDVCANTWLLASSRHVFQ